MRQAAGPSISTLRTFLSRNASDIKSNRTSFCGHCMGSVACEGRVLKLRKVELLGFKSFCEKTPITFSGSGITCIVGPNGCGKSNVVDAISWVLGEQSHKMLRAERMSDCIFNGTARRPPMGISEVTLTLIDPELSEAVAKVMGSDTEQAAAESASLPVLVEDQQEAPFADPQMADVPEQVADAGIEEEAPSN